MPVTIAPLVLVPLGSIMLTQEELKKYVTYDPVDGLFRSTGVKYSNKNPGDIVGTTHKTKGYLYISVKGKTYRAHRLAFLFMLGKFPENQVDHINQVKGDNRWSNLRDVSAAVNSQNRPLFRTNTSGQKGVIWNKQVSKWQVQCVVNRITIYGGLYEDRDAAITKAISIYSELTTGVR
jgi:hypothetical protein